MDYRMRIGNREERVRIQPVDGRYRVTIGGQDYEVDAVQLSGSSTLSLLVDRASHEVEMVRRADGYLVQLTTRSLEVEVEHEVLAAAGAGRKKASKRGQLDLVSPMPGLVIEIRTAAGKTVAANEPLVIVEAMKMRNELSATGPAVVKEVRVKPGQTVSAGQVLVTLEALPA
jgi:biotin carboxyl carrier protein